MRINLFKVLEIELALVALALLATFGFLATTPTALAQIVELARGVVGPEPIAFAENAFYGIQDAYQRWTFQGRTTPGYWTPATAPSTALAAPLDGTARPRPPASGFAFQPRDVTPPYPALAAPGEGVWTPMANAFARAAPPLMYKTFLHSDPQRPYARVAIVAMDATRLRLHAVAGTNEPASSANAPRSGLIAAADLASLVAAFNGGFRAIHGHYGMMVDGQTILPPQPSADTIAIYRDGRVRIAPWSAIANTLPQMQSFRQTPAFLAYQGQVNSALAHEELFFWGKSVSGKTVIWRSALGVSADGRTLFYAAGESLTAQRLAEALVAAGASDVAELDVNLSYQRFLTYAPARSGFAEHVLLDTMVYQPGMYVSRPAARDFFYLTLVK